MLERSIVIFLMLFLSLPIFQSAIKVIQSQTNNEIIQEENAMKVVNQNYLRCLATGIYYEASNESLLGQAAVARVIMNRVLHGFGSNPCKVVYQTTTKNGNKLCQFSWVCEGKSTPNENNPRYRNALYVAKEVLAKDKWNDVVPDNTLFFHNKTVSPGWAYKRITTIGNHVFYTKGREKKTTKHVRADK